METIYLIFICLLFVLAIANLVVGVSNDAVNFLNSAIGSKVADRKWIMIVASVGIMLGAGFSSGMMEVARKGIFFPEQFVFAEVMAIFMAVMVTNMILLDAFNTFGMPTSTTVAIVFELLGASVAISVFKVGGFTGEIGTYINSGKALQIILGILLSVGFAFTIGALVQYVSRLIFSFNFEKRIKWTGGIWGGIALTAMSYFLIIKGLKGASFLSTETVDWVKDNTLVLMAISFVFWTAIMQILLSVFKVPVLKIIVLAGTFSLAMAFAGNDLVNFIGVPIAGLESFKLWPGEGVDPNSFTMDGLSGKVKTDPLLLFGAGLIMVVTLWFSKKAKTVTETEVNLGRQDEGSERFKANPIARGLVRASYAVSGAISSIIPGGMKSKIEKNFEEEPYKPKPGEKYDPPAFDLVRASVNLTVASILISIATNQKLPLSTTYVSFMVAMGTSLADRAWGRDSAVFRISGVLNVIGGWFMTALIAFVVSGFFAFLIYSFGIWAVAGLGGLAIFLMIRGMIYHKKQEKQKAEARELQENTSTIQVDQIASQTAEKLKETLSISIKSLHHTYHGLVNEDRGQLKLAVQHMKELHTKNEQFRAALVNMIRRIEDGGKDSSLIYLKIYDYEQDLVQSVNLIVESGYEHVSNVHSPLFDPQIQDLQKLVNRMDSYLNSVMSFLDDYQNHAAFDKLMDEKEDLIDEIDLMKNNQVKGVRNSDYNARNSMLFFTILLESVDVAAVAGRFAKLFYRSFSEGETPIELELNLS